MKIVYFDERCQITNTVEPSTESTGYLLMGTR